MSTENKFDVVIVGAGVIGSAIAYFLARQTKGKLKVCVLDSGALGDKSSGGAAGMLAAQIEAETDGPFLRFALESRSLFGSLAPELKEVSGIDVEYSRKGIASIAHSSEEEQELKNRMGWQTSLGLKSQWLEPKDISAMFPFIKPGRYGALWSPEDGQVSASRLTTAYAESAKKMGVTFIEHEKLKDFELKIPFMDFLESRSARFYAGSFIFAAGPWTGKILNGLVPVGPVKGQILIFETPKKFRNANPWESPLYLGKTAGTNPINCYLAPKKDGHIFLGATSESCGFDASENKEATKLMSEYACKVFPELSDFPFKGVWTGFRPAAPDHLPVMGLLPGSNNVYVASGHFRNGILLSPVTGKVFSDLILLGRKDWSFTTFSPERFLRSASSCAVKIVSI